MSHKSSDQFDVLSNTLRVLPEQAFRLNYFLKEVCDPEEGITNIEIACVNVFNQIYGMMCSLKEDGHINSIYSEDSITTILCIRHCLQHQSGRIKNNLRDALQQTIKSSPSLIKYSSSDEGMADFPLYLNVSWFQSAIASSNNAKRLPAINSFWKLDEIKHKIESVPQNWSDSYVCIMSMITEAVRQIRHSYGQHFQPLGYDSKVYYKHFNEIKAIDVSDYEIVT
jgi:hypothetical protein